MKLREIVVKVVVLGIAHHRVVNLWNVRYVSMMEYVLQPRHVSVEIVMENKIIVRMVSYVDTIRVILSKVHVSQIVHYQKCGMVHDVWHQSMDNVGQLMDEHLLKTIQDTEHIRSVIDEFLLCHFSHILVIRIDGYVEERMAALILPNVVQHVRVPERVGPRLVRMHGMYQILVPILSVKSEIR